MDLRDYLLALRKSWVLILVSAVLGCIAGVGLVLVTPQAYAAKVQFFVGTPGSTSSSAFEGNQFGQQRVNSYLQLLNTDRLADLIIADTGLELSPNQVSSKIAGTSDIDTVLLTATVTDSSRERTLLIAESLAKEFVDLVNDLETRGGERPAPVYLEILSDPSSSVAVVSARPALNVGLGFAVGLVIGIAIAILRKMLDNSVRSMDSLRALGAPVLGAISFDRAAKKSPLVTDSQSLRSEALRQLRTNLRFVDVASPAKVIVVTSSVPGEGKSSTSTNLAVAFAETGHRVLLVEADLRRPQVAEYLGIEGSVGLTDVLVGTVDVDDVLQPWGDSGMTVLTSGATAPNPSELLGSQNMVDLLADLRTKFDIVLIDTPPLLPVTDGAVTAALADGALLVVRYGKTRRNQILEATESLAGVDARLLGTVLNMVPVNGPDKHIAYGRYGDYKTIPRPTALKGAVPLESEDSLDSGPDTGPPPVKVLKRPSARNGSLIPSGGSIVDDADTLSEGESGVRRARPRPTR